MFAMLGMLVVSIQHLWSGVTLSPNIRGSLYCPRDGPSKAAEPLSEADNALVHCGGHVVLLAAALLMHVAVLQQTQQAE